VSTIAERTGVRCARTFTWTRFNEKLTFSMSSPSPLPRVVFPVYIALFGILLAYWLLDTPSLSDILFLYFLVHLPVYVAFLLEANIKYREEALSQHITMSIAGVPLIVSVIKLSNKVFALSVFSIVFLTFLIIFFHYFSEDWRRGRVERVDVAGLVQGLADLFIFHLAYIAVVVPKAADLGAATLWYFAMYPVLLYVYSAVRLALGRTCPAPLALAAVAYGVSAAVDNLALLPTAALAIPAAVACKKANDEV